MSLLSPDVVTLLISPTQVKGARSSGLGRRVTAARKTDVVVHADDAWQGLSKAGDVLCKALKPERLHVVVSDSLVRYAVFPWREELRTAEEDLAFARLNFDDVYGAHASNEWHLAFSLARPGASRLMVAIPQSLYGLLATHFSQNLSPVTSIQTSFTRVLSLHRGALAPTGWLINLEDDSISFGAWNTQGWTWINTIRRLGESTLDLAGLLARELTISGTGLDEHQPVTVALNAPGLNPAALPQLAGIHWVLLKVSEPTFAPLEDGA